MHIDTLDDTMRSVLREDVRHRHDRNQRQHHQQADRMHSGSSVNG
jgi:hypothetical protein